MELHTFEKRIIELWTTTRIPFTRKNLQLLTQASDADLGKWLDELAGDGGLDIDADDHGEMIWLVHGKSRSIGGPTTAEEMKLDQLKAEVSGTSTKLPAKRPSLNPPPLAPEPKSVLASGLLSLLFGPIGWLYAAPLKDALLGILAWALLFKLPILSFFAVMLHGVIQLACGAAGAYYALKHNESGKRVSLLDQIKPRKQLPPAR